jgi:alpha-ketoglutarate-dependent taurine dioxygenase
MARPGPTPPIKLIHTGEGLGVRVEGFGFSEPPTPDLVNRLIHALAFHGVLIFRGVRLSEEEQVRFTAAFGSTMGHPLGNEIAGKNPGQNPDCVYLVNEPGQEYPEWSKSGELNWHSDLMYLMEPQVYSVLHALEIPSSGGETEFLDLIAAYEALDDAVKDRVAPLYAYHRFSGELSHVYHPMVRLHPVTEKRILYISPSMTRQVEEWSREESREFLDPIFAHMTDERFVYRHVWHQGDLLMWDNRCTLHRRLGFDITQRRVMRRTQTRGERVMQAPVTDGRG